MEGKIVSIGYNKITDKLLLVLQGDPAAAELARVEIITASEDLKKLLSFPGKEDPEWCDQMMGKTVSYDVKFKSVK